MIIKLQAFVHKVQGKLGNVKMTALSFYSILHSKWQEECEGSFGGLGLPGAGFGGRKCAHFRVR